MRPISQNSSKDSIEDHLTSVSASGKFVDSIPSHFQSGRSEDVAGLN